MNRSFLSFVLVAVASSAPAQTPAPPPAGPTNIITENSRVNRFVAGPGNRMEGLLLRNGTFVVLPPGLSSRMPIDIARDSTITVTGDEFTYQGSRTIHAQSILIAGVVYRDVPPPAPAAPPPPPPPGAAAGRLRGPAGRPCPAASAPPPPPSAPAPPAAPARAAAPPAPAPAPPAR